jgi:hypothetical protein
VGVCSLVLVLGLATLLAVVGAGESGVRAGVRATARSSLLLFLPAFVASSLRRLWVSPISAWMLRNRRQIGVSFAVSHALHGALILWLALGWPKSFWSNTSLVTIVLGGIGFAFVAALAATSSDRAVAWLGRQRWKRLHRTGVWYLWIVFFASYVPPAFGQPSRIPYAAAIVGALGLRVAAHLKK